TGQNSIAPENSLPQLRQVRWGSLLIGLTALQPQHKPKTTQRSTEWGESGQPCAWHTVVRCTSVLCYTSAQKPCFGIKFLSLVSGVANGLRYAPSPGNWSEYPDIDDEVEHLFYGCEWFHVYDIIESIWINLNARDDQGHSEGPGAGLRGETEPFLRK